MKFQFETSTGAESFTETVIEAVAEREGMDPVDLTPPLYDMIDPDAVNELLASIPDEHRADVELTFTYSGYQITVQGNGHGRIEVTR